MKPSSLSDNLFTIERQVNHTPASLFSNAMSDMFNVLFLGASRINFG